MNSTSGCCICAEELLYKSDSELLKCLYCGQEEMNNIRCPAGHYICDICHSSLANDMIEKVCIESNSDNPYELASILMKHPSMKMHGPEHHFLVPAVLLCTYYNLTGQETEKPTKIREARKRAEKILGGFCGFYGACGAAVGAGTFSSLSTDCTPLSIEPWRDANLITAKCLQSIAEHGGPRCCKRDTYLAIGKVVEEHNDVYKSIDEMVCEFNKFNRQCLSNECPFYRETK